MKHELSSMKAFVILAESSSFNNAAKLLNITQPALTRRIKKMEEDLHIQLFERTTRKVTLTKAGKRLLPEARELIKKFDETLFSIRDMNAYHRGMVTLACIPTAVFYFLPLAIGKFNGWWRRDWGFRRFLVWQCPMRPILRLLVSHWWNPLYVGHWGLFAAKMPCFLRQLNAFLPC